MRLHRAAFVFLAFAVTACDTGLDPEAGEPPALPDAESMSADFDFFETTPANSAVAPEASAPGPYWLAAALSVTAANVSVAIHSIVPRAILASALSQTPTLEDGRWHWRFDATDGQNTFQSHLIGYEENGSRIFEARVSSSVLQLDDYLLFTGTAPVGGTNGEWTFYDLDNTGAVASVAWGHPEADQWLLTFTALAGTGEDDVLEYEVEGSSRNVSYTDASAGTMVEIMWDATTRAGYIIAPNINSGAMACWDSELHNTPCPA